MKTRAHFLLTLTRSQTMSLIPWQIHVAVQTESSGNFEYRFLFEFWAKKAVALGRRKEECVISRKGIVAFSDGVQVLVRSPT